MKTIKGGTLPATNEKELVITRVFDAPREQVWKAWTEPERIQRWFGPRNFTIPVCTVDLRENGSFHLAMRSPEGRDHWVKGIYREIMPPDLLTYADYFSDKDGNIVSPTVYGMSSDFPVESLITVTFEELNGRTQMRVQMTTPAGRERDEAEQGWNQSFDKLAESLG